MHRKKNYTLRLGRPINTTVTYFRHDSPPLNIGKLGKFTSPTPWKRLFLFLIAASIVAALAGIIWSRKDSTLFFCSVVILSGALLPTLAAIIKLIKRP